MGPRSTLFFHGNQGLKTSGEEARPGEPKPSLWPPSLLLSPPHRTGEDTLLPSKVTMAIPDLESTTQLLIVLCSFGISATQIFSDSPFLSHSVWAGGSQQPSSSH